MKFNVTYWVPTQFAAVAEQGEVVLALTDFIANGNFSDEYNARAAAVLVQLADGSEPADLDIVAEALCNYGFEGGKGEPERVDEAGDYVVEIRQS